MRPLPAPDPEPADPARWLDDHGPYVWAACRRLDPHPEDAYQEIWEKIARTIDRFDPSRGTARTWVLSLTHRHLIDRHRRRRTQTRVLSFRPLPEVAAPPPSPSRPLEDRLPWALDQLPEAHRRVVVLHHLRELPLRQIAEQEGVPVGTLKSRLHRARAHLARLLREAS